MFRSSKSLVGSEGEAQTALYLQKNGFSILKRNFSVRVGEIDIIATKDNLVVFVEVKTRTNMYFNTSQVITRSKQKKIILAAKTFLTQTSLVDKIFRFDVALVEGSSSKITYVPNAFSETH